MKIISQENIRFHSFKFNRLWFSIRNRIYKSRKNEYIKNKKLVSIIRNQGHITNTNLFSRVMRTGIHNIFPLSPERIIVIIKNYILTIKNNNIVNRYKIKYGSRPIRSDVCVLNNKQILFGDYWSNPDKEPVHLYISRDKGESWDVLWKSKAGFARHIHFVIPVVDDSKYIYFGTGDYGKDPGIYKLNIDSLKLSTIGSGLQRWRAVDLIQTNNSLIWGTDCEYDQNHIYNFDLKSGRIKKLREIPGPAYYSTMDKNHNFYIGTTVENRKKHKACILKSSDGINWEIMKCFKKDIWPAKLFGYGVIEFINGQKNLDKLYYNLRGLK